VPTDAATELTLGIPNAMAVRALAFEEYETVIREFRSRGIMAVEMEIP
jgi:hypothetical protein